MFRSVYDVSSNSLKIVTLEGKEPVKTLKAGEDILIRVDEHGNVLEIEFRDPKKIISTLLKSYLEAPTV
ncbi:DUF2283 domain-containing protein [Infirmifilum sp. SLHALR2]|nr:MAG: hypothetical protein B7L53_00760 [Thermofilum sp. NZ13]